MSSDADPEDGTPAAPPEDTNPSAADDWETRIRAPEGRARTVSTRTVSGTAEALAACNALVAQVQARIPRSDAVVVSVLHAGAVRWVGVPRALV